MATTQFNTLNRIIKIYEDIATRHLQVNSFGIGDDWEVGVSDAPTYTCLWVNPTSAILPRSNNGYTSYEVEFSVKVFDLVNKDESNENEVLSDTLEIIKDIVNEFNTHPYYIDGGLDVTGDISFKPFTEKFDEEVSGWETTITFSGPNHRSFCGSPIEGIPGYEFIHNGCTIISTDCLEINQDICQDGDFVTTGDVTAAMFYGDGSNLTGLTDLNGIYNGDGTVPSGTEAKLTDTLFFTNPTLNGLGIEIDSLNTSISSVIPGLGLNKGLLQLGAISSNQIWTMPNNTGTVALTSDIPTTYWETGTSGTNSIISKNGSNDATGDYSIVGGGQNNIVSGINSAILGGKDHTVSDEDSVIIGGHGSIVETLDSVIIGGRVNTITGTKRDSVIIGGINNILTSGRSVILGGNGIVGSTIDTVYVPNLNIDTTPTPTIMGTIYNNLVIDNNGDVMTNDLFYISVNFEVVNDWTYIAPEAFQINTIDNPDGITYTITKNGSAYTLGTSIALYDEIIISGDIVGFLKLNSETI